MCISIQTRSSHIASRESELSTLCITLPSVSPTSASPSSSSTRKQLGLCMVWVFSSRLCFYLLVALRVTELWWSCLSGLMQGGFLFRLCCSLVPAPESQPFQSHVELCWEVLAPGFSSALYSFIYQWGKENAVLGSDPEWRVLFSPWQQ